MPHLAFRLQLTRNTKPECRAILELSESDFLFLKQNFNLNGRFCNEATATAIINSLNLIRKNVFTANDFTELGAFWFRVISAKTYSIGPQTFSFQPQLVVKFIRIR